MPQLLAVLRLAPITLLLAASSGCIGPAAPLTANGAIVGADTTAAAFLGTASRTTAFLAVPRDLSDLESNIVDDADRVWIDRNGSLELDLLNEGSGVYASTGAGLPYVADATYNLSATFEGETHVVSVEAPESPDLDFITGHIAGSPLTIDLAGQGYDYASAFVVDFRGDITWDSRPDSDGELIEELREADGVSSIAIPITAFPVGGGTYIVAVGGFVKAEASDYDGFGSFLSTFAAGKFGATGLSVR
jgi:hypothetical protein